jgi:hypothetical protein
MAAKRHRRDSRAVIEAFRALDAAGAGEEQVALRRVVQQAGRLNPDEAAALPGAGSLWRTAAQGG